MRYSIKSCLECNKEYEPLSAPQKFCSIDCRILQERKERAEQAEYTNCSFCAQSFQRNIDRRRFCSDVCKQNQRQATLEKIKAAKPIKIVLKKEKQQKFRKSRFCAVCNIEFTAVFGKRECCSDQCAFINKKNKKRAKSGLPKVGEANVCKNCQKEFFADNITIKYCSEACKDDYYSVSKICPNCSCAFKTAFLEQNCCSHKCASDIIKKQRRENFGHEGSLPPVPRLKVSCCVCGAEKQVTQRYFDNKTNDDRKFCCGMKCVGAYAKRFNTGKKRTEEAFENHKKTMMARYGVENGYMLARHRVNTKPQKKILEILQANFPQFNFQPEKTIQYDKSRGRCLHADILCQDKKLVIELNGDYWHCCPATFEPTFFHPKKKKTAQQIWQEDYNRLKLLVDLGYSVIVVWERDMQFLNWEKDLLKKVSFYDQKENLIHK